MSGRASQASSTNSSYFVRRSGICPSNQGVRICRICGPGLESMDRPIDLETLIGQSGPETVVKICIHIYIYIYVCINIYIYIYIYPPTP